jgi:DnaK suppressor protein
MTPLHALDHDLRQRLADIRVRLRQLDSRASADIAADLRRDDLCDSAQAIGALEAQTMSVERLTLAAQRITETLRRIADGTYGRCAECDARIPPARLRAVPTAALCVRCQTAAEARAARSGRARHPASDQEEAVHL